jgi:hypothetical protein
MKMTKAIDWTKPIQIFYTSKWIDATYLGCLKGREYPRVVKVDFPDESQGQEFLLQFRLEDDCVRNTPPKTKTVWYNLWVSGPGSRYYSSEEDAASAARRALDIGAFGDDDMLLRYVKTVSAEIVDE